jgi:hypothetical protein
MSGEMGVVAKREYRKGVSVRLQRALEALASGSARTITAAAERAGLTREAVQQALRKPHVQQHVKQMIQESLGTSALRATLRMRELMEDSQNSMTAYQASKFLLGVGAGVVAPSPPAVAVNIHSNAPVGYVIDLGGGDRRVPEPAPGPVIEGEAEVVSLDDRRAADDVSRQRGATEDGA